MSLRERIIRAQLEAFLVVVNYDLNIHQLLENYHQYGCTYLCEDGKITDGYTEEPE